MYHPPPESLQKKPSKARWEVSRRPCNIQIVAPAVVNVPKMTKTWSTQKNTPFLSWQQERHRNMTSRPGPTSKLNFTRTRTERCAVVGSQKSFHDRLSPPKMNTWVRGNKTLEDRTPEHNSMWCSYDPPFRGNPHISRTKNKIQVRQVSSNNSTVKHTKQWCTNQDKELLHAVDKFDNEEFVPWGEVTKSLRWSKSSDDCITRYYEQVRVKPPTLDKDFMDTEDCRSQRQLLQSNQFDMIHSDAYLKITRKWK